ncbi:MAG: reverse transcriptase domain-containing protein [Candidatus Aquirickettsiella gammari]|mgnify:CR=1 FL=1|jgi:retron-type reverse transcriptase
MPSHNQKATIPHPRNFFRKENLKYIWKYSGESDNKAAGYDGKTPKIFRDNLDNQICTISEKLYSAHYRFKPLRAQLIPKSNGKYRIICIPTVRDRLVQRLILYLLTNPDQFKISNNVSYGTKENGVQAAINEAVKNRNKSPWIIKTDITSFFDSIDRSRLITFLEKKLRKNQKLLLLPLLKQVINCEVYCKNKDKRKLEENGIIVGKGLRQGMPLSPFLSNVFLKKFDDFIIKKSINAIRYVDDIIIFCNSEDECHIQIKLIKKALRILSLEIPEMNSINSKTNLVPPDDPVIFLGIEIYKHKNGSYGKKIPKDKVNNLLSECEILSGSEGLNYPSITELFKNKIQGHRSFYKDTSNFNTFLDKYKKKVDKLKIELLEKNLGKAVCEKLKPAMLKFLGID